jgi:hypothetical protein
MEGCSGQNHDFVEAGSNKKTLRGGCRGGLTLSFAGSLRDGCGGARNQRYLHLDQAYL